MQELEAILKEAVRKVNEDLDAPQLETIGPDTDLFESMDSMAIVDLLLETEALLEDRYGRYAALAGDTIFDASASPLKRWSDWVAYVEQRNAE